VRFAHLLEQVRIVRLFITRDSFYDEFDKNGIWVDRRIPKVMS
jgi:hypothetical protein